MADSYSQIYIQIVIPVIGRQSLIDPSWEVELYKYITGIISNKGQKMLAINGMPDHIHFFIGMKPSCCLSDLVREVKKSSNEFVNERKLSAGKFQWQKGYGAFSYSHSALDRVIRYINNQKDHHRRQTFSEEYLGLLKEYYIDYKPEYLFDKIE